MNGTSKITFGSACAINDDMLYVASFADKLENTEHTRMFVLNLNLPEKWHYHDINHKTVISIALRPAHTETIRAGCSLTTNGEIEIYNSNGIETLAIPKKSEAKLTSLAIVDNIFFACGGEGQIYQLDQSNCIETGYQIAQEATSTLSKLLETINSDTPQKIQDLAQLSRSIITFQCIDGLSKEDIYTCGTNGTIYHWNGASWNKCKSGTRQHLHNIHCISTDEVLICGHNGTIVRGNYKDGFKRIPTEKIDTNFWCIKQFNKQIFIGTTTGLFLLNNKSFENAIPSSLPTPHEYSIENLSSTKNTLWVTATKFILRLQNGQWELIEHPDNL
ncbi:hypothetical protein KKQ11_08025 [Pseudomonas sp. MG-2]|jgi:hypothetical protein|uniref:WD40/YVTN/BNR-like repeat-containing protein n=1 Tax=Pseudomonas sp. MG-2 TaxID=405714 RepID=UPI001BFFDE42|nr:hypothetical protein [Pseudomonas sp. MG-2]MBT9235784.1 hypothetical protein [Pseudomonas sp. MG-2]